MGGDQQQSNVIIPDTGAAKYWYVDPRAQNFNPMQYADNQGHNGRDPQSDEINQLTEALRRIGVSPNQDFSF